MGSELQLALALALADSMLRQSVSQRRPESRLALEFVHRPDMLIVAIQGEASSDQAEELEAQLLRAPLDMQPLVVLNLAELTFIGSLAMGALVGYRRALLRRGVDLKLANLQGPVWLSLQAAGLAELFPTIDLAEQRKGHCHEDNAA